MFDNNDRENAYGADRESRAEDTREEDIFAESDIDIPKMDDMQSDPGRPGVNQTQGDPERPGVNQTESGTANQRAAQAGGNPAGQQANRAAGSANGGVSPQQWQDRLSQGARPGSQAGSYSGQDGYSHRYSYQMPGQGEQPAGRRKRERGHKKGAHLYVKVLCCALIFGAVSGGMILGSFAIGRNAIGKNSPANTSTAQTKLNVASGDSDGKADISASPVAADGTEYSVAQIANQCKSSVVAITNKSISEVQTMFGIMEQESTGSGSGVIIGQNDTELLIVTNNHVVEGAQSLTVCFNDSKDAIFDAKIKGTDPENDLAVIAINLADIDEEVLNGISVATIGDSSSLQVGDHVVAIGNALGFGQSVTDGIVSAVEREVTIDDYTATLLQTDAAINPGNSGGALLNMKGELIGINTAKYASAQIEGMGFAIPMEQAKGIIEDLMNRETRDKLESDYGFLSIKGKDVAEEATQMYGIPQGAYIAEAIEGGAAAKAGLIQGDIITAIGGTKITGIEQLKDELQYYQAGEEVEVTFQRNSDGGYQEQKVTVTLDNASEQQSDTDSTPESNGNGEGGLNQIPGWDGNYPFNW